MPKYAAQGQKGGSYNNEMTLESQILGATVMAIIGGGAIKFLVETMGN
jgi:hypothetical protein